MSNQDSQLLEWQFDEKTLLAAVMILHSVPCRTIEFAMKVLPELRLKGKLSCTEMGSVYGCTRQAARHHVSILTVRGYLVREGHSEWREQRLNLKKIGATYGTEGKR